MLKDEEENERVYNEMGNDGGRNGYKSNGRVIVSCVHTQFL